jgi:hypothetical protein
MEGSTISLTFKLAGRHLILWSIVDKAADWATCQAIDLTKEINEGKPFACGFTVEQFEALPEIELSTTKPLPSLEN